MLKLAQFSMVHDDFIASIFGYKFDEASLIGLLNEIQWVLLKAGQNATKSNI